MTMEHNTKSLSKNMTKHFIVIVLKLKIIIALRDEIIPPCRHKSTLILLKTHVSHQINSLIFAYLFFIVQNQTMSYQACSVKRTDTLPREICTRGC